MRITLDKKCIKNERNEVTISGDHSISVGDIVEVVDTTGEVLYSIPINQVKTRSISHEQSNTVGQNEVSIFVGEPVLDVMINSDKKTLEYVSGGQALSQAIAYKKANPGERVIFIGNFGTDEMGQLDENGNIIKQFLESIGIEVKGALVYGKQTRHNYVVVDKEGRTILNPMKKEDRPNIDKESAMCVVDEVVEEFKAIKTIGIDGSLEYIIRPLIEYNPTSIVEVDAGRKTQEQQDIVKFIHTIFEQHSNYYNNDKLHILASRSYANEIISSISNGGKYRINESSKASIINSYLLRMIQEYKYPSASFGVTIGSCGCLFVDEEGKSNYLPSYDPEKKEDEDFKDNSAGDTFHALLLSAISKGLSLTYAYQYASIGTSIAGYGRESTAKMNTPLHEEIMDIIINRNPYYKLEREEDIVEWVKSAPHKIEMPENVMRKDLPRTLSFKPNTSNQEQ